MDMDYVSQFIKPQLLILVPVLFFIGSAMKKNDKVKNKDIPTWLGVIGIVLSAVYVIATSLTDTFQRIMMAIFTATTQGILCAGCSVFVHQIIKHNAKNNSDSTTERAVSIKTENQTKQDPPTEEQEVVDK